MRNPRPLHAGMCLCDPKPGPGHEGDTWTCSHGGYWVRVRRRNHSRWIKKQRPRGVAK